MAASATMIVVTHTNVRDDRGRADGRPEVPLRGPKEPDHPAHAISELDKTYRDFRISATVVYDIEVSESKSTTRAPSRVHLVLRGGKLNGQNNEVSGTKSLTRAPLRVYYV